VAFVYRPLTSAADRARAERLLAAGHGYRSPGPSPAGVEEWYGLWDLTAADVAALRAAAATLAVSPAVLEVRAVVTPVGGHWPSSGGRLVRELADAARARGAHRLVAVADDLLAGLGFRPVDGGNGGAWLALDL
jgi:hypothetical protein